MELRARAARRALNPAPVPLLAQEHRRSFALATKYSRLSFTCSTWPPWQIARELKQIRSTFPRADTGLLGAGSLRTPATGLVTVGPVSVVAGFTP